MTAIYKNDIVITRYIIRKGDNMEDKNKVKTADSVRRAVENYRGKKDVIYISVRKGLKDEIKKKYPAVNLSEYIQGLIDADLSVKAVSNPFELPF